MIGKPIDWNKNDAMEELWYMLLGRFKFYILDIFDIF